MSRYPALIFEPVTAAYIDSEEAIGAERMHEMGVQGAREWTETPHDPPVPRPEAQSEDATLPCGPTGSVRVRITRPPNSTGTVPHVREPNVGMLPAIIYLHGGGWILGTKESYDRAMRELAIGANAAVVFVDHDRSPEFPYPIPVEQAYAVANYVAEHGAEMNIDGSRLAVMGDSAGGNMTAVVTIMAKERGGPKILLQGLLYPCTDASMSSDAYKRFAPGPWLSRGSMEWFWNAYAPDSKTRRAPYVSPSEATIDQLRGLPPAVAIMAEHDILVDEAEDYVRKLMHAGVPVAATRYVGVTHGFVTLDSLAQSPAARNAIAMLTAALRGAWASVAP
jgi:acetyl esterase/lipase